MRALTGELSAEIEARDVRIEGELTTRGEVEAELAQLRATNLDLADRLTQAQIRRLQAEKLLLEAKIRWLQTPGDVDVTAVTPGEAEPAIEPPFVDPVADVGGASEPASEASRPSSWDLALEDDR